jgi:hypothetical protein
MQRPRNLAKAATLVIGLGGLSACPHPCFIAGTRISTPDGFFCIEDIRVGQSVYSYDEASQQLVIGTVSRVFVHEDAAFGWLALSNQVQLGITEEHPVYLPEQRRYVEAQALRAGQELLLIDENAETPLLRRQTIAQGLKLQESRVTVYNFSVERFENYFASGVLVHNKSPLCDERCQQAFTAEVSIQRTGDGSGTIVLNRDGVCAMDSCNFTVQVDPYDPSFTGAMSMIAAPDATSSFYGWGGLCSGVYGCTIELQKQTPVHTVSAQFTRCNSGEWCAKLPVSSLLPHVLRSVLVLSSEQTLVFAGSSNMSDPLVMGSPVLWQFKGGQLSPVDGAPQQPLYAAAASSQAKAWAVGRAGTILWWSDAKWTPVDSRTTNDLHGAWADATSTWVVGEAGTILRGTDSLFATSPSNTTANLNAVWGSDATSIWAVGNQGTILRWNGAVWSPSSSGTTQHLYAVWGRSATEVWAVGAMGTILKWDGGSWTPVPSGTTADLHHVRGSGGVESWISGRGGTLLRWDGAAWSPIDSGTTADLFATWQSADGQTHVLARDHVRSLIP